MGQSGRLRPICRRAPVAASRSAAGLSVCPRHRRGREGELPGLDEVTAYLERSHVEGERTFHLHGDVPVQLDGDRAKATAKELTYFHRDGEPPYRTSGLRVACTAVRTPAGRRFSETRITLAWMQEK